MDGLYYRSRRSPIGRASKCFSLSRSPERTTTVARLVSPRFHSQSPTRAQLQPERRSDGHVNREGDAAPPDLNTPRRSTSLRSAAATRLFKSARVGLSESGRSLRSRRWIRKCRLPDLNFGRRSRSLRSRACDFRAQIVEGVHRPIPAAHSVAPLPRSQCRNQKDAASPI